MKAVLALMLSPGPFAFILLEFSSLVSSSAQTSFERTYGGAGNDAGSSVQQTSDGGYIIAGWTTSFGAGSYDAYVVKTDSAGDTLWTRTYGGPSDDFASCVQQTSDGGYIIAGTTYSFGAGSSDVYLAKTNHSGDTIWTRTYGGANWDYGYSVQQSFDGGYIIAGWTASFSVGFTDAYLVRTNSSGDTLWTRTYGGTGGDVGYSVQQTSDSGYVIAGYADSFDASHLDAYLVKTNPSGDTVWTRTYGGSGGDHSYTVRQTSDGGYIIAGWTFSFGADTGDAYLIKTTSLGDTVWTKTYGGTSADAWYSVQQISDDGYIVAGQTYSFGAGSYDVYLDKTNSSGDELWSRTYGGTGSDGGYSVQQTSDGGYIIAGKTSSFGVGFDDMYLIKTLGDGTVSARNDRDAVTRRFTLQQNYPNPFNSATAVSFSLPSRSFVSLKIFDLLGREICTLVSEHLPAGNYTQYWDASGWATGAYFCRIQVGPFTDCKKLMLLR
jgi:hypothetical protein